MAKKNNHQVKKRSSDKTFKLKETIDELNLEED